MTTQIQGEKMTPAELEEATAYARGGEHVDFTGLARWLSRALAHITVMQREAEDTDRALIEKDGERLRWKGEHGKLVLELNASREEANGLGRTLKAVESALGPGAGTAPVRVATMKDVLEQVARTVGHTGSVEALPVFVRQWREEVDGGAQGAFEEAMEAQQEAVTQGHENDAQAEHIRELERRLAASAGSDDFRDDLVRVREMLSVGGSVGECRTTLGDEVLVLAQASWQRGALWNAAQARVARPDAQERLLDVWGKAEFSGRSGCLEVARHVLCEDPAQQGWALRVFTAPQLASLLAYHTLPEEADPDTENIIDMAQDALVRKLAKTLGISLSVPGGLSHPLSRKAPPLVLWQQHELRLTTSGTVQIAPDWGAVQDPLLQMLGKAMAAVLLPRKDSEDPTGVVHTPAGYGNNMPPVPVPQPLEVVVPVLARGGVGLMYPGGSINRSPAPSTHPPDDDERCPCPEAPARHKFSCRFAKPAQATPDARVPYGCVASELHFVWTHPHHFGYRIACGASPHEVPDAQRVDTLQQWALLDDTRVCPGCRKDVAEKTHAPQAKPEQSTEGEGT